MSETEERDFEVEIDFRLEEAEKETELETRNGEEMEAQEGEDGGLGLLLVGFNCLVIKMHDTEIQAEDGTRGLGRTVTKIETEAMEETVIEFEAEIEIEGESERKREMKKEQIVIKGRKFKYEGFRIRAEAKNIRNLTLKGRIHFLIK